MTHNLTQMVHFVLKAEDGLADRLRGATRNSRIAESDDRIYVWSFSENDDAWIRMAASDQIITEEHSIGDQALDDKQSGDVHMIHRVTGPAVIRIGATTRNKTTEAYVLWGQDVLPADHAAIVALGIADDKEAFKAWFAKRQRKLKREGGFYP